MIRSQARPFTAARPLLPALLSALLASTAHAQCAPNPIAHTPGAALAVSSISTTRLAAAYGDSVRLVDVSTPSTPLIGGTVTIGEPIRDLDTTANTYVVAGSSLYVIDDNTFSTPTLIGGAFIGSGFDAPLSLDASGNFVYVVSREGLRIFDVAVPQFPTLRSLFPAGPLGEFRDLHVVGSTAYIVSRNADQNISFLIAMDITNPAAPTIKGSAFTSSEFLAVASDGVHAYVSELSGFSVYNVTNPIPAFKDSINRPSNTNVDRPRLAIDGARVYEAAGEQGLQVYNVSNPAAVTLAAVIPSDGSSRDLAVNVSTHRVFLADIEGGLRVFDINPALPVQLGTSNFQPGWANDLLINDAGTHAYLANGRAGLAVMNISNPAAPSLAGALDLGTRVHKLARSGNLIFAAAGRYVRTINVSNPAAPTLLATYGPGNTSTTYTAVGASGSIVLVTNAFDSTLRVLTAANPSALTEIGSVLLPGGGVATDITISGARAYVIRHSQMAIVDLTVPSSPVLLKALTLSSPLAVAVSGNYAYVAGNPALEIIDVSNPSNPVRKGFMSRGTVCTGITLNGPNATLCSDNFNAPSQILFADISDPDLPTELYRVNSGGVDSQAIALVGVTLHLADGVGGYRTHQRFTTHPPAFREQPPLYLTVGDDCTASLPTSVIANPPATYRWLRNDAFLSDGPTPSGSVISGSSTTTLTITNLKPADAGQYVIRAINACGITLSEPTTLAYCKADVDCSGFLDFEDYISFVAAFEAGVDDADFDGTGFVDTDDFTAFVQAFEIGC